MKPPHPGGFFVPYTQQVLAVLVRDRHLAIAVLRSDVPQPRLRRRVASAVYALAKAVTLVAVVLDDEPLVRARERAR
jgi:hypothetical protein